MRMLTISQSRRDRTRVANKLNETLGGCDTRVKRERWRGILGRETRMSIFYVYAGGGRLFVCVRCVEKLFA